MSDTYYNFKTKKEIREQMDKRAYLQLQKIFNGFSNEFITTIDALEKYSKNIISPIQFCKYNHDSFSRRTRRQGAKFAIVHGLRTQREVLSV